MTWTAETWPIACAMLPFGDRDSRGGPIQDAAPEEWAQQLRQVRRLGFTEVDPTDTWVRIGDLEPSRLADFAAVLADVGLTVPASRRRAAASSTPSTARTTWPTATGSWTPPPSSAAAWSASASSRP